MKAVLADRIGFRFGVRRAVRMAEEALARKRQICSLGSIIHNDQVVRDLSRRGLRVIKGAGRVGKRCEAILISSHGISPKTARRIKARGLGIIDTTCPFVRNAQMIARSLSGGGYTAIIVGDSKHPEVKALVDFAPRGAKVVGSAAEAARLRVKPGARLGVISQTTQSTANFLDVVRQLAAKRPRELRVFDTICNDAGRRQELAEKLASRVDAMLVIGGFQSANTRRLYEVSKKVLGNTHLIETEADIDPVWLKRVRRVGIASGASTPDWVVKQVVNRLKCK